MQVELDPRGRKVVIFGDPIAARQVVRRYVDAGATVTLVTDGPLPSRAERTSTVRYAALPSTADRAGLLRLIGPAWLIVDVTLVGVLRERVAELAGHLHVLLVREDPAPSDGQVTLVGGGPGRTSLLTLEACAALRSADVVFYDRLAPTDELRRLAPGAELIDVGKSPYHHPVSQTSIEELMVMRARRGDAVVRLKGGDPFVFGRGGEEMQACLRAGVPVRVVPGVSSALSVPAASGVPVTHRGIAKAFTVISGHIPPEAHELESLARLGGTIVILMGMNTLAHIVIGLARAGLSLDTPAAVFERGYSDQERRCFTTMGSLLADVGRLGLGSPAVVVIGDVVSVSPHLAAADVAQVGGRWVLSPRARAS